MKYLTVFIHGGQPMSRPARALWIEMSNIIANTSCATSRGPRGPCGLKSALGHNDRGNPPSRPARALWIEMDQRIHLRVSSPRRGPRGPCGLKSPPWSGLPGGCRRGPRGPCGLKLEKQSEYISCEGSRPARALWIEIYRNAGAGHPGGVEAREGLVD